MKEDNILNYTEHDKREKFVKKLITELEKYKKEKKKFEEETEKMKPTIGELADGYKSFIEDLGPGFLEIAENYNMCIEIAKSRILVGNDVKLKARIKDFSSSRINSDKKILDDVFGMEIVSPTNQEKEFWILFNKLIFDIPKEKKYNKENGYNAYHCIGDLSISNIEYMRDTKYLKDKIKKIVNTSKIKEYKLSKTDPEFDINKDTEEVSLFPELKQKIKDPELLEKMVNCFEEMIQYMKPINDNLTMPLVEIQFKTSDVASIGIMGTASHTKYKPTDEEMIIKKFKKGQLIRGVNSPWKFEGTEKGLELQDFYETLEDNWPFLKDTILERRNAGKEPKDRKISSKFDILTSTQLPFLKKYINPFKFDERKKEEIWVMLKFAMIANRLDETKSLEDETLGLILGNDIWKFEIEENGRRPGGISL